LEEFKNSLKWPINFENRKKWKRVILMQCPSCHKELIAEKEICPHCTTDLQGTEAMADGSLALDIAPQPIDNMELFVGEKYSFYEEKWNQAKDPKIYSGFNVAGIFAPFWMAYRKMYGGAASLVLGYLGLRVIMGLRKVDELDFVIGHLIFFVFLMAYFMFKGNSYYYNFAKKKILSIQEKNQDKRIQGIKIEKAGGTNIWGVIGIFILLSLTVAAANVFLPAAADPVRFVKNSEFEEYPNKKIRSAFENYFNETSWELEETGEKQIVKFSGEALSGGQPITVKILFDVDMEKKELMPAGYFLGGSERPQEEFDALMKSVFEYN
jgi:hypothetical protein